MSMPSFFLSFSAHTHFDFKPKIVLKLLFAIRSHSQIASRKGSGGLLIFVTRGGWVVSHFRKNLIFSTFGLKILSRVLSTNI